MKLGAAVLSADYTFHSQVLQVERNERMSLGKLDAKPFGKGLALKHIAASVANWVFKHASKIRSTVGCPVLLPGQKNDLGNMHEFVYVNIRAP